MDREHRTPLIYLLSLKQRDFAIFFISLAARLPKIKFFQIYVTRTIRYVELVNLYIVSDSDI